MTTTIAAVARRRRVAVPPVPRRAPDAKIPISEEQRHVWIHNTQAHDTSLYNEPFTILHRGRFDREVFQAAFNEMTRRHEIWRTVFEVVDGEPFQVVHDSVASPFRYVDLADLSPDSRETEALALAEVDAWRPFDLRNGPLFRGRIAKFSESDHRIYLVVHHLLFDGATINRMMIPELAQIYAAFAEGRPHGLDEPAIQYGDYAIWQRAAERGRSHDAQLAYWRRALGGPLPILQLPADRPRPTTPSAGGAMETFTLGGPVLDAVRLLSRTHSVTFYMVMLASFGALMYRYSGQDDIIVGSVADTRQRPETQSMMGYCINALGLRSRPTAEMTVHDYIHQIRDVVIGGLENSNVPFANVVHAIGEKSEPAISPVFQVMFSFEPTVSSTDAAWRIAPMQVAPRATKYDLYIEIADRGDLLEIRAVYATDLFDSPTIVDLTGHWQRILEGFVADPNSRLIDLSMLDDGQAAHMLTLSQGASRPVPDTTLHELARQGATGRGEHPAVRCGPSVLTHADLWQRVDELTMHLRLAGIGSGDIVAVCLTRSADSIAAPLAILQTGAAYLPLDPSLPAVRLDAIVSDALPALVIANRASLGRLPASGVAALVCDDLPSILPASISVAVHGTSDDRAYLIYTSGSTGIPKGVEIEHRAVVNLLESMRAEPGFGQNDTLFSITTPTFDISILEMFLPLVTGGTVVLATDSEVLDPALQAQAIGASGATVVQGTPATWRSLFTRGWSGVPGLKILSGGEALPRDLADQILDAGMDLWNMYGPTETTIWSSIEHVDRRRITIGYPIDNTQMLVLDDAGRPQPPNTPGHLLIGGMGLARGYRDAALTRASFVALDIAGGQRFYRTGDIALLRRDGRCEWLGRRDGQVKIRGYRIDLGDIESAIAAHRRVATAAVRTIEVDGQPALAAYFVTRSVDPPSTIELREHLRQLLPSYMIPAYFGAVAELPLSTSGKVDRNALPMLDLELVTPALHDAPRGDVELRLAAIWCEALSVSEVSATAEFQDMGGHSLMAARMMSRIESEFGRRLPISSLLHAPTVRTMAAMLEKEAAPARLETLLIREGTGAPLFWIDAVPNFRPGYYRAMASAITSGAPVVGLPLDLERYDDLQNGADITQLASDLADRIQAAATGPHRIGGWCNGGILAYAVAVELENRGDRVALLILLDTSNPTQYRRALSRLHHQLLQFVTLPSGYRLGFAAETLGGYTSRLRRRYLPSRSDTDGLLDLNDRFMRIVKAYDPPPLDGTLLLLQPRDGKIDYAPGWRGCVCDLKEEEVDGGHLSVLDMPHAADLGKIISRYLAAAGRSGLRDAMRA